MEQHQKSYHDNARVDILPLIDAHPGRVLDVGGGTGATAELLKHEFGANYAVVIDNFNGSPRNNIDRFIRGDLQSPEIWKSLIELEGRFDTILCLDVLEHMPDPWSVVGYCHALLSHGGSLIVSIPNVRNYELSFPLFFRGRFDLKKHGVCDRTHLRWFVKNTAKTLVTCSGLELEHCSGGWYLNRSKRWERLAKYGIAPSFLFQLYYLRARKNDPHRFQIGRGQTEEGASASSPSAW